MIRTYQPSTKRRARTCGFRTRMRNSPNTIKARRAKGRWRITPNVKY
ncbi:MAG: 50S ribosomal protein L34 [Candidatus Parcubacteria bacterium]|nr:50S ribosomal protein L34 [Candidatus Paceibacterota bacterium]